MYTGWSAVGIIGFFISLGMGFYKLFAYENSNDEYSFSDESVNAYVGGDAYNFIINGTYTTAYFVLAGICLMFAVGMLILDKLHRLIPVNEETSSDHINESYNLVDTNIEESTIKQVETERYNDNEDFKNQYKSNNKKIYLGLVSVLIVFAIFIFAWNSGWINNENVEQQNVNTVVELYEQEDYEEVINMLTTKGSTTGFSEEERIMYSNSIFKLFKLNSEYYVENVHSKIDKNLLSESDQTSISSYVRKFLHERRNSQTH